MPKFISEKDAVARGARDASGAKMEPPKRPIEERILEALNGIRSALNQAPEPEAEEQDDNALKELVLEMSKQTALLSALVAEKTGHVVNESPYIFDIKRDGNGFIQQVIVTPDIPVRH